MPFVEKNQLAVRQIFPYSVTFFFVYVVFWGYSVFSPGFFEGAVGGGAGIRARRWEK